jgi:hypothetical protein
VDCRRTGGGNQPGKQFTLFMLIVLAKTALLYLNKQVQPDNQGS